MKQTIPGSVKLGVTGGIGSGKTLVCTILSIMGYPVYYADTASKALLNNNESIRKQVTGLLGEQAYLPSGDADRKYIASMVFNNPEMLDHLNGILHPAVKNDFEEWMQQHASSELIIKEAAIMFESGSHNGLDYVLTVNAPEALRIKRVMDRDGTGEENIRKIMTQQMTDDQRAEKADFIITNDDQSPVLIQVLTILEQILPGQKA